MQQIFFLLVAAVAGIAMAIQGSLNSVLGKVAGQAEATLVVHVLGAITAGLVVLLWPGPSTISRVAAAPWYSYLGGALGVLIIFSVVASIPRLGVALATTAIIVGQVTAALAIDHFGLFGLQEVPFTWWKLVGVGLLAAGARLMLN